MIYMCDLMQNTQEQLAGKRLSADVTGISLHCGKRLLFYASSAYVGGHAGAYSHKYHFCCLYVCACTCVGACVNSMCVYICVRAHVCREQVCVCECVDVCVCTNLFIHLLFFLLRSPLLLFHLIPQPQPVSNMRP